MAEEKYALSSDPSKISPYGASQEQLSEYQKSLENQINALEQRYREPNWFKVSAGFLKPQLGGFAASLGSASEAMGENVEKQRESQIPIAQMRAQLAQSNILLNSKSKAAEMAKQWEREHPGEPYSADLMAKIAGYDKELADRLGQGVKQNLEQRTLSQKEQAQEIDLLGKQKESLEGLRKNNKISQPEFEKAMEENYRRLLALQKVGPFGNTTRNIPNSQDLAPGAASVGSPAVNAVPGANPAVAANNAPAPAAASEPVAPTPKNETSSKKQTPQENLYNYDLKPTFSSDMHHPNAMTENDKRYNANIDSQAALLEKGPMEQFQMLQKVVNPTNYNTALKANQDIEKMIQDTPEKVAEVSELLRRQGGLAALLSKGIGVHLGPYGATVSLHGLEDAAVARLNQTQRDNYDKVTNALAKSVYYDLLSRGINPEQEGAEKFGQRMLQEVKISQGAAAIHRTVAENLERLKHSKQLHKAISEIVPKLVHKTHSLTPYHDAYNNHPEIQVLNKMLADKLSNIQ